MGELKVTPEGMPSVMLAGASYPLFFPVYGVQRWAEYKGVDYQQALEDGWDGMHLSLPDLSKLMEIALSGGEARRVAFGGGEARTVGDKMIEGMLAIYSPVELALVLARAWNALPEGEPTGPNPEAPRD
jgi:hypothetical protein